MNQLTVRHLSRKFGSQAALQDVSFTLPQGETLALLGPSGAGKTTLLRILAGLETADQGQILLDDRDLQPVPPHERGMAMIFQNAALFPHITVADNIGYGLANLGFAEAQIPDLVQQAAQRLHIESLLKRYPGTLSAGERQRAGIARALVRRPRILLLDEPFSSLDLRLQEEMQDEVLRLQKEEHMSMLLVTHDQQEALKMAGRIGILLNGRLAALDEPQRLYASPPSAETADFLGEPRMNLIPVRQGRWLGVPSSLPDGTRIGFRARDAQLTAEGEHAGIILACRWSPDGWLLVVQCQEEQLRLLARHACEIGAAVRFAVPQSAWHIYPAEGTH